MYTTEAIVLKTMPMGEADELVSIYTKDFGKLRLRARSSKKITTKQGNFIHSMAILSCNFVSTRAGYLFSGIKSIRGYTDISEDISASAYVSSFFTLCDDIFYDGQKDEEIWQLLCNVLEEARGALRENSPDEAREYLWRREKQWLLSLLAILGLKPKNLNLDNVKNARQLDIYLQRVMQNKLERKIEFFGMKATVSQ
ncbi:MAG: DNA repair protein RecO [Candidatus Spechtbacterales bacterium]|nr:DNA repair protein RecO [Candidatus Spechtbacterales bacterium]